MALWSEALTGQNALGEVASPDTKEERQIQRNIDSSVREGWRLISAKRFEELAWAATKSVESHLISGKKNIALVAQDRLVARRARALLSRLGNALRVRDETGWKLSTTRAAAAFDSLLE